MKRRYRILLGLGATLVVGIAAIMVVTAHASPCPRTVNVEPEAPTMRAMMHRCYGVPHGLRVEHIARPVPGEHQVLIKVHASSVNPAQWYGVSGQPYLLRLSSGIGLPEQPRVGLDVAGTVEAVGPGVTLFAPGDEVFGGAGGSYAEYALAREDGAIARKPENLSFEQAAGVPTAAITALQGLRDHGHLVAGQRVLINGASGGVGTYAVQIAKAMGAHVTAVCSTRNVGLVRSLGADDVIDYTRENFTTRGQRYDLILDNVGNHGYVALGDVVEADGYIVTVGSPKTNPWLGPMGRVLISRPVASLFVDAELPFYIARLNQPDLEVLADWAREGKLRTVIDRTYPLEHTAAALEYLGTQRARGKVIVTVD